VSWLWLWMFIEFVFSTPSGLFHLKKLPKSPLLCTRTHVKLSVYSISRTMMQSKHNIATLFVQLIFWRYVKSGGNFEYGTVGNFFLCTFVGTKWRWHYTGGCLYFISEFFYIEIYNKNIKHTEIHELCCICKCWFFQC
jgi:hypothetical protein